MALLLAWNSGSIKRGGLSSPNLSGSGWASSRIRNWKLLSSQTACFSSGSSNGLPWSRSMVCGSIRVALNRAQTGRASLRTCARSGLNWMHQVTDRRFGRGFALCPHYEPEYHEQTYQKYQKEYYPSVVM